MGPKARRTARRATDGAAAGGTRSMRAMTASSIDRTSVGGRTGRSAIALSKIRHQLSDAIQRPGFRHSLDRIMVRAKVGGVKALSG